MTKEELITREEFLAHLEEDRKLKSMVERMEEKMQRMEEKLDTIIRFFDNLTFSKKFFLTTIGVIATVIGIVIGIKNIWY